VLANGRSSRKPSRKGSWGYRRMQEGRQKSGTRFETTAQIGFLTTSRRASQKRGGQTSLDRLLQPARGRRRPQMRRSQARLGTSQRQVRYEAVADAAEFTFGVPARRRVHVSGSLFLNLSVLGLLVWGISWFFAADRFYVDQVIVTGNERVAAEVIAQASGLRGYSIFFVNPQAIAAKIMQTVPPIQQARVRYALPNVVTVDVVERADQIMWQFGGKRFWVDDGGGLHLVQGESEPQLLVKDTRPEAPTSVEPGALTAAQQLAQLLPTVRTVEYAPITGLRLTTSRNWTVYLGIGDDMADKIRTLRAIEARLAKDESAQPLLLDLRFPERPYYRPASQEAGGD
jgi:cell division protein FtsQ